MTVCDLLDQKHCAWRESQSNARAVATPALPPEGSAPPARLGAEPGKALHPVGDAHIADDFHRRLPLVFCANAVAERELRVPMRGPRAPKPVNSKTFEKSSKGYP
jgi:hypothetical protein